MSKQNEFQWPEHLWARADVVTWISSVLDSSAEVVGPTTIYNEKLWGVTAAFGCDGQTVIFKGCKLPLFAERVHTEALLSQHAGDLVPDLLGTKRFDNGETWTLHRTFVGPDVETTGNVENVLEMARTLACLQARVADLSTTETAKLVHTPIARIPEMLDHMVQRIDTTYLDAWHANDERWLKEFNLPTNVLEQIEHFRPRILKWTEELMAGDWPLSLDHLDFNISNAAVLANGQILIFDWEEATMSCPFFSIDRLLQDADDFEDDAENVPRTEGALRLSSNQMAVRNAYLDTLPWKSRAERERAFELAMCLAPIKTAYECEPFNDALGRKNGLPPHAAHCFGNALHYWQSMAGYNE